MRKVTIALLTLAVIAGGGAWYVLSYMPSQIRADIDATIEAIKPEVEISFAEIDIDIIGKRAVLTDVFARSQRIKSTFRAKKVTVVPNGDGFDATLEGVTAADPKKDLWTAAEVTLDRLKTIPVSGPTDAGRSAPKNTELEAWQKLSFEKMTARRLASVKKGATIQTVTLENFRRAKFGKATVSSMEIKDDDGSFRVASMTAESIDIAKLINLPRTLGGAIEWSNLDTGKIGVRSIKLDLGDVGAIGVGGITIDGVDAGRLVRMNISDSTVAGGAKHPRLSIKLKKIELNDFPIITDFPTTREELISFQTRHKSLIYGGFDIRGFDLQSDGASMKIDYATMPPPRFGKTPSGKRYIADATSRMKMSIDLALLDKGDAPLDPAVLKLINGGKLTLLVSGRTLMDHAKKTMSIPDLTMSAPGNVSLKLTANVGNLPLRYYETPGDPLVQQIAISRMTLADLSLVLTNDGIADRLFDAVSEREGIPRERVPEQLAAAARTNLARDGSAEARAHADEIIKFLSNPKSLKLVMKPERPIPLMSLANPQLLESAGKVGKVLGLELIANEGAAR